MTIPETLDEKRVERDPIRAVSIRLDDLAARRFDRVEFSTTAY